MMTSRGGEQPRDDEIEEENDDALWPFGLQTAEV